MRVAVEKMEGVGEVAVSLEKGEVVVELEEENTVELDALRTVIREQGFTPREADVRMKGTTERRGRAWVFRPTGWTVPLHVEAEATVLARLGEGAEAPIEVRGHIGAENPLQIRITSVQETRPAEGHGRTGGRG